MIALFVGIKAFLLITVFAASVVLLMKAIFMLYCFGNGEEYAETSSEAVKTIGHYLTSHKRGNDLLYDFGCSQGDFLFRLIKTCKNLRTIGIERDRIKIFYAHLQNIFSWNKRPPIFLRNDFMTIDISKADVIFIYVPKVLLPQVKEKLQRELGKKAIVILYKISFVDWSPIETIDTDYKKGIAKNKIFIYQNPI